jgi:hypothetical protein
LAQALSTGEGAISPLWTSSTVAARLDGVHRLTDPLIGSDIDDQVTGELYVWTNTGVAETVGYIMAYYVCDFIEPTYSVHSGTMPIPNGNIGFCSLIDNANQTANNTAVMTQTTGVNITSGSFISGAIFKLVFAAGPSTAPTGQTLANTYQYQIARSATTTTLASTVIADNNWVEGKTVYGVLTASNTITLYMSLDTALAGGLNGAISYTSTPAGATKTSTLAFWAYPVQYSPSFKAVQT